MTFKNRTTTNAEDGKTTSSTSKTELNNPNQIVVQFKDNLNLPNTGDIGQYIIEQQIGPWENLKKNYPNASIQPLFENINQEKLNGHIKKAKLNNPKYQDINFFNFFKVTSSDGSDLDSIINELKSWENIQQSYIDCKKVNPLVVNYSNNPRAVLPAPYQDYLELAPKGISAKAVWDDPTILGSDGAQVNFIDIEKGWTLNHVDLVSQSILFSTPADGTIDNNYRDHGSSVLGVVCAADNYIGCVGIAPKPKSIRVISESMGVANAILKSIDYLSAGDVLLVESVNVENEPGNAYFGYEVPIETTLAEFGAIELATTLGIIVVEPGGNGNGTLRVNFDNYTKKDSLNISRQILNPANSYFKNSKAIIVSASKSTTTAFSGIDYHEILPWAPLGGRVDCYAWGENITTLSSDVAGSTNLYRDDFGGTSGAAAIIAGAIINIQGMVYAKISTKLSPDQIRSLLKSATNNTNLLKPLPGSFLYNIFMPNLKNLFDNEILTISLPSVSLNSKQDVTCFGLNNGAIDVNISGGKTPYSFEWTAANGGIVPLGQENNEDLTGLVAGDYTLVVTDAMGFKFILTETIAQPTQLIASAAITNPITTNGNKTEIVITANGGTPPYTYSLTDNSPTPLAQTPDPTDSSKFPNLSAGTYNWSVTDANGCGPVSDQIIITEPPVMYASAAVTIPIDCTNLAATVKIIASGGTPPYEFSFNGGAFGTANTFSGLVAGTYLWSARDSLGCTKTGNVEVYSPAALVASAQITVPIDITNPTATVKLIASGGTPPYNFSFDSSTPGTNNIFSSINPGTHTWLVTDQGGCSKNGTVDIIAPTQLFVADAVYPNTLNYGCPGIVVLVASGGTMPYTYTFNGKTNNSGVFADITPGSYSWSVTDASGNTITGTTTVNETSTPPFTIYTTIKDVACFGKATGSITVNISGGTPPFTFIWSNGATTKDIANLKAGTYTCSVIDSTGTTMCFKAQVKHKYIELLEKPLHGLTIIFRKFVPFPNYGYRYYVMKWQGPNIHPPFPHPNPNLDIDYIEFSNQHTENILGDIWNVVTLKIPNIQEGKIVITLTKPFFPFDPSLRPPRAIPVKIWANVYNFRFPWPRRLILVADFKIVFTNKDVNYQL